MADLHPRFRERVKAFIKLFRDNASQYEELVTGNAIFRNRMMGVGTLSREDAISYGCTGPTARGSGVQCDIRKLYPYEIYDKLQFDWPFDLFLYSPPLRWAAEQVYFHKRRS